MSILYGEKKLEPLKFWIETKIIEKSWLLFWTYPVEEYWVCSDFINFGPFESHDKALAILIMADRI